MITEEVQPTRLARGTQKIHDLLALAGRHEDLADRLRWHGARGHAGDHGRRLSWILSRNRSIRRSCRPRAMPRPRHCAWRTRIAAQRCRLRFNPVDHRQVSGRSKPPRSRHWRRVIRGRVRAACLAPLACPAAELDAVRRRRPGRPMFEPGAPSGRQRLTWPTLARAAKPGPRRGQASAPVAGRRRATGLRRSLVLLLAALLSPRLDGSEPACRA